MNNKKIIFMGSPKIASDYLEALIKSNFIISAVFSQPPKKKSRGMKIIESEVHQLANKNNIEVFCPNIFDKNTIETVKKLNPEQSIREIQKLKKDLFNMRFKKINGQIQSPAEFNKIKKNIARLYNNVGNKK